MKLTKGLFITIEGIDGSGKTTFANNLYQYFLNQNLPVIKTKEPSETPIGQQIRAFLQKKISVSDKAEFLIFAADRAEHFKDIIIPNIKSNKIIISDRNADSSLAYQGYGRGLDLNIIKQVNQWVTNGTQPDITFYLKIEPKIALDRVKKRNEEITEFENLSFMQKIADGFDDIFKNRNNVIILVASNSSEQVLQEAIGKLNNKITL